MLDVVRGLKIEELKLLTNRGAVEVDFRISYKPRHVVVVRSWLCFLRDPLAFSEEHADVTCPGKDKDDAPGQIAYAFELAACWTFC